jgi:hypothetical protein
VAVSIVAGLAWTVVAKTNEVSPSGEHFTGVWQELPRQLLLWFFQSVGAFPARNEPAPGLTYAVVLAAWGALALVGWLSARRTERVVLLLVVLLASAVPLAVTVRAYPDAGLLWQGRYGYPFALGFLLICGHVLAARRNRHARGWPVIVAGAVVALSQPVSQVAVLGKELAWSPLAGSDAWITLPAGGIVALAVAGAFALTMACARPGGAGASRPVVGVPGEAEVPLVTLMPGWRPPNAEAGSAPRRNL